MNDDIKTNEAEAIRAACVSIIIFNCVCQWILLLMSPVLVADSS